MTQYSFEKASKAHAAGDIYVGVPVVQGVKAPLLSDDELIAESTSSDSTPSGFVAFVLGLLLGSFLWVSTQCLVILSVNLFHVVSYKNYVLSGVGYTFILMIIWYSINVVVTNEEDECLDEDITYGLQDLCLLGSFISQFVLYHLFSDQFYNYFGFHLNHSKGSNIEIVLIFWMLLWMLITKMRHYTREQLNVNLPPELRKLKTSKLWYRWRARPALCLTLYVWVS